MATVGVPNYTTRPLDAEMWPDFARLRIGKTRWVVRKVVG